MTSKDYNLLLIFSFNVMLLNLIYAIYEKQNVQTPHDLTKNYNLAVLRLFSTEQIFLVQVALVISGFAI